MIYISNFRGYFEHQSNFANQHLPLIIHESNEVKETTEQEDGVTDNQCSKCNFIGKTEAGLKTRYRTKHVPLFKRYTKVQME